MKINSHTIGWVLISGFGMLLFVLAVYVSNNPAESVGLKAPGWSRASLIGNTRLNQAVPPVVDEEGNIYLLLFAAEGQDVRPQVLALNQEVESLWEHTFELPFARPEQAQILWDGQQLHLFWLDKQSLYTARLDAIGNVQLAPLRLSGETAVASYDTALDAQGEVFVWYGGSRREPGVYALAVNDPQPETIETLLIDEAGLLPALAVDDFGTLHSIRTVYSSPSKADIYYATYPNGEYPSAENQAQLNPAQQLTTLELGADSELDETLLGMDQQQAYLLWVQRLKTGRRAGQQEVLYVTFPLDQPQAISNPEAITIPTNRNPLYNSEPEDVLTAGPRVALPVEGHQFAPWSMMLNPHSEPELAMASSAMTQHLQGGAVTQIVSLFGQEGQLTGYQLLSFTPSASFSPALISDKQRQLYLTWLERNGTQGFHVYFAGTAPAIQQALSGLSWSDAGRLIVEMMFGMLQGVVYAPFMAALWLVVPCLVLALTWFLRRGQDSLTDQGALISLGLALITYWASKIFSFAAAGQVGYVPFSAWIFGIPTWLGFSLQLVVPLLIALISFKVAWHYIQRSGVNSVVLLVLLYVVIDSLLTMAIYGGLLFDAF